jgi:transcriptional regulator with XRE-family HTH domain
MNIADRIDTAMKMAGQKTQAELSRSSGVAESTIARILKGGVQPSIDNLAAIAKSCRVSIDWIVNGIDISHTDIPEVSLVYVTLEELKLITQFRESNAMGKSLIKTASNNAPKKSPIR